MLNSFMVPPWILVLSTISFLPLGQSYCPSIGWNPQWLGPPVVEQISLTSVRVSWGSLLEMRECADSLIVKHFKGLQSSEMKLSDELPTTTNSYIVRDIVPFVEYTYQVIAREEKGLLLGVEYNRSPKTFFTTNSKNTEVSIPLSGDEDAISLEVLLGIAIGVLICVVVLAGIVYNFSKKKVSDKDLDLESSLGEYEDEEDEDDEDDNWEYVDESPMKESKYKMVLKEGEDDTGSASAYSQSFNKVQFNKSQSVT